MLDGLKRRMKMTVNLKIDSEIIQAKERRGKKNEIKEKRRLGVCWKISKDLTFVPLESKKDRRKRLGQKSI